MNSAVRTIDIYFSGHSHVWNALRLTAQHKTQSTNNVNLNTPHSVYQYMIVSMTIEYNVSRKHKYKTQICITINTIQSIWNLEVIIQPNALPTKLIQLKKIAGKFFKQKSQLIWAQIRVRTAIKYDWRK